MNHKELLEQLIRRLETEELPFYESRSEWNWWAWHIAGGVSLVASLITALLAGLLKESSFESNRIYLVIIPILGSAATGFSHLYKFREKEALREDGRIEVRDIIDNAQSFLVKANSDIEFEKAYHSVRERAKTLEANQHRRDIALRNDEMLKGK